MSENSVREQYTASAGHPDGTVRRFLCRVALSVARSGVRRFDVAPDVWQALAFETNYASVPGTRAADDIELQTCTGWIAVHCNTEMPSECGMALIGYGPDMRQAPLDFASVI
jgi:hypothetical protein